MKDYTQAQWDYYQCIAAVCNALGETCTPELSDELGRAREAVGRCERCDCELPVHKSYCAQMTDLATRPE